MRSATLVDNIRYIRRQRPTAKHQFIVYGLSCIRSCRYNATAICERIAAFVYEYDTTYRAGDKGEPVLFFAKNKFLPRCISAG